MPRLLARLVLALMLVMGQGLAGQNRASANLARPDARIGTQVAYNQLSYHENLASAAESRVGYVLFGQAANYEAGNLIAQEEKANPNDPDWAEDGTYSLLLHGLIGAAQGAISGGGNAGTALAGGVGAVAGTAITPVLAAYLEDNGVPQGSAEEKLLLTLASSAIGAGTGALTGGGATGAVTGSGTAAYSTTYNYLDHAQTEEKAQDQSELATCEANPGTCSSAYEASLEADIESLDSINAQTNLALYTACGGGGMASVACSQQQTQANDALSSLLNASDLNGENAAAYSAEINETEMLLGNINGSYLSSSNDMASMDAATLGFGYGAILGTSAAGGAVGGGVGVAISTASSAFTGGVSGYTTTGTWQGAVVGTGISAVLGAGGGAGVAYLTNAAGGTGVAAATVSVAVNGAVGVVSTPSSDYLNYQFFGGQQPDYLKDSLVGGAIGILSSLPEGGAIAAGTDSLSYSLTGTGISTVGSLFGVGIPSTSSIGSSSQNTSGSGNQP